ncbi:MAG: PadR family transcriptional regulator [Candidatus Eremiobacteraeota bacterium]|nr:PadR family transcriptional regulator [Candidatus Eremiobacteraeota bacterium]
MDTNYWSNPGPDWWGWHGGRRGMRRMRRGLLKLAVLKLLSEVPRHGYDLIRTVRERGWGGGAGSVYPILTALEGAGLIAGREEGERRIYQITEEGKRLLGEHAAELERILNEDDGAAEGVNPMGDRLRESADKLMRAVSALGPSSKPETIERACELLNGARKGLYELLAEE